MIVSINIIDLVRKNILTCPHFWTCPVAEVVAGGADVEEDTARDVDCAAVEDDTGVVEGLVEGVVEGVEGVVEGELEELSPAMENG